LLDRLVVIADNEFYASKATLDEALEEAAVALSALARGDLDG
jgi:hypothetical protein